MNMNRLKKEHETPKAFLGCFFVVFFSVATFMGLSPLMQKCDTAPKQYAKVYKKKVRKTFFLNFHIYIFNTG
jgi:hypothetical protein